MILTDKHNRNFSYLRLSITDLCNFNCKYCFPENLKIKKYLSIKEIYNLISCLSELGIEKIRITGGEPTVRKDFVTIGKVISNFKIKSLVFTTNAYRLNDIAEKAKNAGFDGVNISLDTLNESKFFVITGKNYFAKVYNGIIKAINIGLKVKINVVLSNFFSFKDFRNFYTLLKYKNLTIRFIDQMDIKNNFDIKKRIIKSEYLIKFLKDDGWNLEINKTSIDGPSKTFKNINFMGKIGIINPYSKDFCITCNRLRVSSTGEMFLCLFGQNSYSIRNYLDSSKKILKLKELIIEKTKLKSHSHSLIDKKYGKINSFSSIGG